MAANGNDLIPDAEKLQTLKDLDPLSISKDEEEEKEEEEKEVSDDVSDSSSDDFNERHLGGFEDPKILRLVEGALGAIRKSLENYAHLLQQEMKGNTDGFDSLRALYHEDRDEFRELLQSFADLLEEEKKGRKLSNLVEKLIATNPDANRHLCFFMGGLDDKKHEQGVSELLNALEIYL